MRTRLTIIILHPTQHTRHPLLTSPFGPSPWATSLDTSPWAFSGPPPLVPLLGTPPKPQQCAHTRRAMLRGSISSERQLGLALGPATSSAPHRGGEAGGALSAALCRRRACSCSSSAWSASADSRSPDVTYVTYVTPHPLILAHLRPRQRVAISGRHLRSPSQGVRASTKWRAAVTAAAARSPAWHFVQGSGDATQLQRVR